MLAFPAVARRLLILLAALSAAVLTARLGVWQLDRAAQKEALRASILQRGALPPLEAAQLARDEAAARPQTHRRIVVSGRWLHRFTVFLDNRQMGGRPGFFVVTPLQLPEGDCVLVAGGAPRLPGQPRGEEWDDRAIVRRFLRDGALIGSAGRAAA